MNKIIILTLLVLLSSLVCAENPALYWGNFDTAGTSQEIIDVVDPFGYYNSSKINDTQLQEQTDGFLGIKWSWFTSAWDGLMALVSWAGDLTGTGTSPEIVDDSHFHDAGNVTNGTFQYGNFTFQSDLNVGGYITGKPIDGALDSGVLWADSIDEDGNVNLTHLSGLSITYPEMIVRLATTGNVVKHCNISSDTVSVTDEQHSVYYVDNNCVVQNTNIETYINTDISPGGITDIFSVMAHSGDIKLHIGAPVQNKINVKVRKNLIKTDHLNVVSGMEINSEVFPNFTQTEGEYIFVTDVVNSSEQNLSANNLSMEFVYRTGGTWDYNNQDGINLTDCDDGTNLISCSSPTLYRRYLFCTTGFSDGEDQTEVHQLASTDSETYSNLANCLNVVSDPVTVTLPEHYIYTCALTYAYCGKPTDTSWSGSFIDLRETKTSTSSADIDTSIFLTTDGTRSLTANWNQGLFNLTNMSSYFLGWTNLSNTIGSITESQVSDYDANATADFSNNFVNITGDIMTGSLTMSNNYGTCYGGCENSSISWNGTGIIIRVN